MFTSRAATFACIVPSLSGACLGATLGCAIGEAHLRNQLVILATLWMAQCLGKHMPVRIAALVYMHPTDEVGLEGRPRDPCPMRSPAKASRYRFRGRRSPVALRPTPLPMKAVAAPQSVRDAPSSDVRIPEGFQPPCVLPSQHPAHPNATALGARVARRAQPIAIMPSRPPRAKPVPMHVSEGSGRVRRWRGIRPGCALHPGMKPTTQLKPVC